MRLVIKNTSEEEKKKLEKLKRRTAKQERSKLSETPCIGLCSENSQLRRCWFLLNTKSVDASHTRKLVF